MEALKISAATKRTLWLSLSRYHFDHLVPTHLWDEVLQKFGGGNASLKAFADKISRKHGWGRRQTMQTIWEYKKFVYLGVIADFPVTPSKVIDTVWHEHLLFSKGYREFCEEVIHQPFDHNPELIPVNELTATYAEQYLQTLALYRYEFGAEPPAEVWYTTKFDDSKMALQAYGNYDSISMILGSGGDSSPLCASFSDGSSFDFGGGDTDGGGAGGSWDSDSDSSSDSGSDSGSSCSSCSSGCGGGD